MKLFIKILLALSSLSAALSSCTKFDELQQQIDEQNARIASLPSGIVMLTNSIYDRHKGDTCDLMIRVNPSDYVVKKENLSFLASHNIYTCFTDGEETDEEFEPEYDPTVVSDFSVVAVLKDSVIKDDGIWHVKFAVNGKGNYFDDVQLFMRAETKDASGKTRSVCSATPCAITVTPTLQEGLKVNTTGQNLFAFSKTKGMLKTEAKPYVIGLWSNGYVNSRGQQRLFDRTTVKVASVPDSLYSNLGTDLFASYGFVTVTPDFTAQFWKDQIALEGKQPSIEIADAYLSVQQQTTRAESADLPFKFKLFYGTHLINTRTLSISKGDTTKTYTFDYTPERKASGNDELTKIRFMSDNVLGAQLHVTTKITDTKDQFIVKEIDYPNAKIGNNCNWIYGRFHRMSSGQAPTGERVSTPDSLDNYVQYYLFKHIINIVE